MVRKCRAELAEIPLMEVAEAAVKTRARDGDDDGEAPAMAKRRKLDSDRHVRLRNSQTILENSGLDPHDRSSTSSCSGSSDRIENSDLENTSVEDETSTYCSCKESEDGAESEAEEQDIMAKKLKANSRRRSTVEMMPTEVEIEQFFAKAEKQLQKEFAEKFNYDIVKDEPMEGRYEWIQIKP